MKRFRLLFFIAAGGFLFAGNVVGADDTGWMQPGVRVWYIGATGAGVNSEEANLIDRYEGTSLRIVRHTAVAFWSTPTASVLSAPNPASEGPFWISPARLRNLKVLDAFSWNGLSLVVKARVTYQRADDLPFFAYLPVQALYQAKSPRELITLTGNNDGVVGDYFFDVETGLGLSSSLYMPGFYIMMMLSEINHDFATHTAFAEDNGPHTGYRASQMAGRSEYPVSQFYLFEERVVSRYRQSLRTDLTIGLHNIASGQSFQADYTSWFDGENRQFWITPIGVTLAATTALTTNGTHGFFWVPPRDLTRNSIRVWDVDLALRDPVGADTVFASDQPPATGANIWGVTRLQLDSNGYVREMVVQAPWMDFNVDSTTASAGSTTNYVTGRAYYQDIMGQAIPACPCVLTPTSRSHPLTADAGTFTVTTDSSCDWTAITTNTWLHTTSSGTGSGTVSYQVDVNDGPARVGTVRVASQTFTVNQAGPVPHDFAILSLKPPKTINLKAAVPTLTKRVKVQIQNLSPQTETISNLTVLVNLVSVTLSNLHTSCTPPTADLIPGPPNIVPKTLKPKGKVNVFFNVTFSTNCVPDAVKSTGRNPGHEDFSYTATLNPAALDGNADTNLSNDVCPRPPNPAIGDKGCGNKDKVSRQLGADMLTDVVLKP